MASHYQDEEAHQRHLEWRREYYRKNREHIRERDNAAAKRLREENPERYRRYSRTFQQQKREAIKNMVFTEPVSLKDHPDRDLIMAQIEKEKAAGKGGGRL